MDAERAIEIVQALADGVDPFTGERFPSGSPYQQADTVRALHLALEGLTKLRRSTARKTGPGRAWLDPQPAQHGAFGRRWGPRGSGDAQFPLAVRAIELLARQRGRRGQAPRAGGALESDVSPRDLHGLAAVDALRDPALGSPIHDEALRAFRAREQDVGHDLLPATQNVCWSKSHRPLSGSCSMRYSGWRCTVIEAVPAAMTCSSRAATVPSTWCCMPFFAA